MRRGLLQYLISVWFTTMAFCATATADIVVDQPPTYLGGYVADTEFQDGFGMQVWQREADNIRLTQSAIVRAVVWRGFYGGDEQNHLPPDDSETLRVRFYGSRASDGLPDDLNVVFEQTFVNLPRTATGQTIAVQGRPAEYLYQTELDNEVSLLANTTYWLEIAQIGDLASTFRWETGFSTLTGHAFTNSIVPDWQASSGSFAFQLSTVPEPCSALLFLCTFGLVLARRAPRRMPGVT